MISFPISYFKAARSEITNPNDLRRGIKAPVWIEVLERGCFSNYFHITVFFQKAVKVLRKYW